MAPHVIGAPFCRHRPKKIKKKKTADRGWIEKLCGPSFESY